MRHFLVFSGTTEGSHIAEQLGDLGAAVSVSVATVYGKSLVPKGENITVFAKRLTTNDMVEWFNTEQFEAVIDATHPYAVEVTSNIKKACRQSKTEYIRLLRESIKSDGCTYFASIDDVIAYLNTTVGNVMLTTGSKELARFTEVKNYKKRLFPRVLPTTDAVELCQSLGIPPSHILAMQGPFSEEFNVAVLKQISGEYLLTKESGDIGGFEQKLAAAKAAGAALLVIGRPQQEQGFSAEEILKNLVARYGLGGKIVHAKYFPLFVNLENERVVVIGAGDIATRRVDTLLGFGCDIILISPKIDAKLMMMNHVRTYKRAYHSGDCEGARIVCAATDDREVNHMIYEECARLKIPVSVADCREECSFYFPAIVTSENVVIGVTASGEDHTQVRRVAENIRNVQGIF